VSESALPEAIVDRLAAAGCIAPRDEAVALVAAAQGDAHRLDELVGRRCGGEPLAWLVGAVSFCGEQIAVASGVYVPRPQSEVLAAAAVRRLPEHGVAVDLCTGSGALAAVLSRRRPQARVVATEVDPLAAACARDNGVEVFVGDLAEPLPPELVGRVDVVTAVAPYVPTDAIRLLPRDVVTFEPRPALDGGSDGLDVVRRIAAAARELLRPGGWLIVELGGDQDAALEAQLRALGYAELERLVDEDDDLRGVCARRRLDRVRAR
jgi:release factor glutamine methyltransferase